MVRRIYRMALEGYGLAETATAPCRRWRVNPPTTGAAVGQAGGSKCTVEPTKWGHTTVKKILTLQEYCGDVINFKSYSKSYKMKKGLRTRKRTGRSSSMSMKPSLTARLGKRCRRSKKGRAAKAHGHAGASVFSGLLKCPGAAATSISTSTRTTTTSSFSVVKNHNSGYRKCSKTHYIRLDFFRASRFVRGQAAGLLRQRIRK